MSVATNLGNFLINTAKLLAKDVTPKTNALVIAANRLDRAKFIAPTSRVDQSAVLGRNSSVWFNAKVGAGTKIGEATCIMDGAIVEENCVLGDLVVVKPGAVIKKGSNIGARAVVGVGAVVPEKSSVKENVVLVDGWNGTSVTESKINAREAEEEVNHILQLAVQQQTAWSKSLEEREEALLALEYSERNPVPGDKWETFVSVNPNPNRNPERRGLIYDK